MRAKTTAEKTMPIVDTFKQQHAELVDTVQQLDKLLQSGTLASNAAEARSLLAQLSGKLKVHLSMEDKNMYPKLQESADPNVKGKAQKFIDEMGGIAQAFTDYTGRWPNAIAIQQNPDGFIQETKGIFAVLADRIHKEESELYPLVNF